LVPAAMLPVANGRIELARTAALAAGPALGGLLVGWIGGEWAYGLATTLSIAAVLLLAGIAEPARRPASRRHVLPDVREGAAFVFGHRLLGPIFVTQVIFNVAFFVIQAVYVPYAVHALGLSASGVGITLGAFGAGMVIGAVFAARLMAALDLGAVVAIGPICGLAAALLMLLTIWVPSPILAACSFFLAGIGPILWVVSTTTLRQVVTPDALLGRVSAINSLSYGARPIGAAIGAAVGGLFGAEACFVVAALLFALQATVILLSPVVRLRQQPSMSG